MPVISEEIDVGNVSGGKPVATTFSSPVVAPRASSGASPSMADLNAVTKLLSEGPCVDVDQISSALGMSKETVVYCIEWLVSQGLIAQDSTRYCGLSSVKRLCDQLKGCKECFK